MGIVFARVDNRLIHGQVVEGWLPTLKVKEVVVISADGPKSPLMQKMLRMSLPSVYDLKIFDGAQGAAYLKERNDNAQFVLIDTVKDLKDLIDGGLRFDSVNIGNIAYETGKKEAVAGVFLNEKETRILKEISGSGIFLDVRALPSSMPNRRIV
jgi:PTS system mannose-specific IIB component